MSSAQLTTPVALIIFRRPEHTRKVLEALARVRPEKLFVIADGPRQDRLDDEQRCQEARALVDQLVTWDCDVRKNYAADNLGCGRRPASGIDWVFSEVESAIILEDDCVPGPSFFPFCEQILECYREDERVMHVSGSTLRRYTIPVPDSYYFSAIPTCWGWATWRRAWKHFDMSLSAWPTLKSTSWLQGILEDPRMVEQWSRFFEQAYDAGGDVSYWDYQWAFACWTHSGLAVVPRDNLVTNTGFGADATHTLTPHVPYANLDVHHLQLPLRHPPRVFVNRDIDRRFMREVAHPALFVGRWGQWRRALGGLTPRFVKHALRPFLTGWRRPREQP